MRFFLIDRIIEWDVGSSASAVKNVAMSEDFFDDHFPRRPIMPGVLMIEGMAQLAGLLLEASLKERFDLDRKALLTVLERTKFRDMVRPGDRLTYTVELRSLNEDGGKASLEARRDDRVVVTSAAVFAFIEVDDPELERRRAELLKTWLQPVE